ncbi:SGNH/GDSL hydrolase family protein [Paraliobacillus ryukyuensis]|uniref:SGNH/GDSL hydrolase family protein n=1 Tax=Paraliobacillus ryukyuensis TaxID=200904 RepID=UPI0009A5DD08|nr:GDSL-type esterase/lipase family protein [Paraliobacillus ryukyuensis]
MAVPTNIEELAHDVRNAIYGSQVREAIASSMEATADVADWARQVAQDIVDGKFDEGLLATEIESKLNQLEQDYAPTLTDLEIEITDARGSFADLAARLLSMSNNISNLSDQVDGKIGDLSTLSTEEKSTLVGALNENSFNLEQIPPNQRSYSSPSNTIVLLGDSITNQNYVSDYYSDRGYFIWINALMGQAFTILNNAGVSGQRTDEFLLRLEDDVISYNPSWCFVLGGTNDIGQGRSADDIYNDLVDIYETLSENNIKVIASTIPPSTTFDTIEEKQVFYSVNRRIKEYAKNNPGLILLDMGSAYVDPTSTNPIANSTEDGIHPSAYGAVRMAELSVEELDKHIPKIPSMSYSNDDPYNLLSNGSISGTSGNLGNTTTGEVADNWWLVGFGGAEITASKVSRDDFPQGEWQKVEVTVAGSAQFYSDVTSGFSVGETIYGQSEFKIDENAVVTTKIDIQVVCYDSNDVDIRVLNGLYHSDGLTPLNYTPKDTFVLKTPFFQIPEETVRIRIISRVYLDSGSCYFGRSEISKI